MKRSKSLYKTNPSVCQSVSLCITSPAFLPIDRFFPAILLDLTFFSIFFAFFNFLLVFCANFINSIRAAVFKCGQTLWFFWHLPKVRKQNCKTMDILLGLSCESGRMGFQSDMVGTVDRTTTRDGEGMNTSDVVMSRKQERTISQMTQISITKLCSNSPCEQSRTKIFSCKSRDYHLIEQNFTDKSQFAYPLIVKNCDSFVKNRKCKAILD